VRVADKARLLIELQEVRREIEEAARRLENLHAEITKTRAPLPQVDRVAS
jgi:hypothetical protein